jgi:glutamyl-tRNA reductase
VTGHLYTHTGGDAVRHLFRVAASLDSLVLGEPQILGQVKDAYDLARESGTVGTVLHRLIPRAIRAAKRVRSETTIGAGQVSVPSVAVDLARQIFGDLSRHRAALVGSGEMGEAVAKLLRQGGSRLFVLGRNQERVGEIARAIDGEPRGLHELRATLAEADVVVTTTSAPGFVVDAETVAWARKARRGRSLFFIDLAVPRDVDPSVGALDGVFLYNVDDLSSVVAESFASRRREAEHAERIVREEAESYERWADAEQATPTIVALRERLGGILLAEVDRSLSGKLRHLGGEERAALAVMVDAALNKMLHSASTRLRALASEPASRTELEQAASALRDLFELDPPSAAGLARESRGDVGPGAAPARPDAPEDEPEGEDLAGREPGRAPGGPVREAS